MTRLTIILILFLAISCKEKVEPVIDHTEIDFSYADDIPGTYTGPLYKKSGPPFFVETDTIITIEVIDARNSNECKFYVDYFDDYIYVFNDLTFYTPWKYTSPSLELARFDSSFLLFRDSYSNKIIHYLSLDFKGEKQ